MIKSLADYGNWHEHTLPFKHFRAENILDESAYKQIETNFLAVQNEKIARKDGYIYKLERFANDYDAHMLGMDIELSDLFHPFFSVEFLKSVAELLDIPFIYQIDGALHSSQTNSRTGWIHNDYCSVWFDGTYISDHLLSFPARHLVDYFTGSIFHPLAAPRKFVRAATLIFYLCNDGWKKGDGGETGIYGSSFLGENSVVDFVEPLNNSLFLFECTPHSYHRFITNPGRTRNSIIFWLHSSIDYAAAKWPNAIK